MAIMIGYLRRTRLLRTLAVSGAGIACMALTLLLFCHPVEVHPMDFLLHIAAGLTMAVGENWVSDS